MDFDKRMDSCVYSYKHRTIEQSHTRLILCSTELVVSAHTALTCRQPGKHDACDACVLGLLNGRSWLIVTAILPACLTPPRQSCCPQEKP